MRLLLLLLTAGFLTAQITQIPGPSGGGGGTGCVPAGSTGQVITDNGAGSCTSNPALNYAAGVLTVGTAGSVVGNLTLRNATSGSISLQPVTGALGTSVISIPAATDTMVLLATSQNLTNKTLTSPTLVTPALGTPASGVATNLTGLPLTTGVAGILPIANGGTGVVALFATNAQITTYQVSAADFAACKTITVASGTFTITLVASGAQPTNGQCITILNYGTGVVTLARSGQNINGAASDLTGTAGSATAPTGWRVYSDGTNYVAQVIGGGSGGSGTVTSVSFTGGLISVATATTTPALTVAGTSGGIPYFSSSSAWASSAALTSTAIVVGGGVGAAPSTIASITAATTNITLVNSTNAADFFLVRNTNAGVGATADFRLDNDAASGVLYFGAAGTGYTTSGPFVQDGGYMVAYTGLSGGLSVGAGASNSDLRLYAGGVTSAALKVRIGGTNGNTNIGQTACTTNLAISLGVMDCTATTGVSKEIIQAGQGQSTTALWEVRDYNATLGNGALLLSVSSAGRIVTAAGNETTGAGTPLLGANSPAVTNTAPYTWIRFTTSDGSAVFMPAWK